MNKDYYRLNITKYERESVITFFEQILSGGNKAMALNQVKTNLHGLAKRIGLDQNETNIIWERVYGSYQVMLKRLSLYHKDKNKFQSVFEKLLPALPVSNQMQSLLNQIETRKKTVEMDKKLSKPNIVFYICSVHSEPLATGHKGFQGKIYINQNWREKIKDNSTITRIESYIRNHHIRTVEWVLGAPVYMTFRPNCKHKMIPIPTEEVLTSSARAIIKRHGLDNPPERKPLKINVQKYKQCNLTHTINETKKKAGLI